MEIAAVETSAHRAVEARIGGHISFVTDHRFDPGGAGLLVEIDGAEEIAVVGHGQSRLVGADFFDPAQQVAQPGRSVEQAVLGVLV